MASKLYSFRLPDEISEALLSKALPGESPNLTAQRVLTEALGFKPESSTPVDRRSLEDLIESIVDERISYVVNSVNTKLTVYEEKLEALEKPET